jgi:hypothetical protein
MVLPVQGLKVLYRCERSVKIHSFAESATMAFTPQSHVLYVNNTLSLFVPSPMFCLSYVLSCGHLSMIQIKLRLSSPR